MSHIAFFRSRASCVQVHANVLCPPLHVPLGFLWSWMGVAAVRSVQDKKVNFALKKTCVMLSVVWSVTTAPVSQTDPESVSVSGGNMTGISGFKGDLFKAFLHDVI